MTEAPPIGTQVTWEDFRIEANLHTRKNVFWKVRRTGTVVSVPNVNWFSEAGSGTVSILCDDGVKRAAMVKDLEYIEDYARKQLAS